jgi:hypothetical protein
MLSIPVLCVQCQKTKGNETVIRHPAQLGPMDVAELR